MATFSNPQLHYLLQQQCNTQVLLTTAAILVERPLQQLCRNPWRELRARCSDHLSSSHSSSKSSSSSCSSSSPCTSLGKQPQDLSSGQATVPTPNIWRQFGSFLRCHWRIRGS